MRMERLRGDEVASLTTSRVPLGHESRGNLRRQEITSGRYGAVDNGTSFGTAQVISWSCLRHGTQCGTGDAATRRRDTTFYFAGR